MTYNEQLLQPKWYIKRDEILTRDNNTCTKCGNTTNLHVHHIEYHKNAKAWEYRNKYLITLCSQCHKLEHLTNVIPTNDIAPYRYTPPKIVKTIEEKRETRKLKKEQERLYQINVTKSIVENYKNLIPSCIEELNSIIAKIRKIDNTTSLNTIEVWYEKIDLTVNSVKNWKHKIPYDIVEEYLMSKDHIKRMQDKFDEFTKQLKENN